ncbi:flagellar hook-basal body complex protein FliE [Desulfurobacterium atlanticum]|uniref:Flagellar hook-basal body complex protein FliE n=1 Tax=Desulfurobacterium atlanticum TaxID=240169 RepID=A0A238Z0J9_9BACT|nr:flagellar hook-basal body complex protein FliE [Desulfurobacterium atlanticum]SNR76431.1 flagellar hook-basal body complex protein FliE [Desulfurobacterium atlanticum]
MKINGLGSIKGSLLSGVSETSSNRSKTSFTELLEDFIKDVNNDLNAASQAEEKIMNGNVENFEELLYTISKSEISLRLLVEIRNKALESYQEIMRMQV